MKHIKNMKGFVTGITALVAAVLCFGTAMIGKLETRLIIAGVILISWSAISLFTAFTKKGTAENFLKLTDERDRLIVLKSSNTTLKIVNYLMGAACFISLCLYGIFKNSMYLTIAITLCGCLVVMFLTMLLADTYYNRRE